MKKHIRKMNWATNLYQNFRDYSQQEHAREHQALFATTFNSA